MIALEMGGRLGNQLFRYAYARMVIEKRGRKEALVFGLHEMRNESAAEGWVDSLRDFNILPHTTDKRRLCLFYGSFLQRLAVTVFWVEKFILDHVFKHPAYKTEQKWHSLFNKLGILFSFDKSHEYDIPMETETVLIDGLFENSKYFKDIRDILLKEYTPRYPEAEHNKDLYKVIRNTNSVCISIRRGDYLSKKFKGRFFVCDSDYFGRAIKVIREKVKNPVFIFFSDDIEWVKNNIKIEGECYYERGDDPVWEKLRLMYNCKHFIISNSTFSWWAQYLSRNNDKVVVSPTRWYNTEGPSFLIEESFIKV